MFRTLDLFSGIGGFSLGLERTGGFKTVAFCEIEAYPRAVLAKHWPGVVCFNDVRLLNRRVLDMFDIEVDVICGGFPCQDISLAGRGAGLAGERSGLWSEYHRLIDEIRPAYAIIENVSALRGRGLDQVLGSLAAIGYDAEWHCIPAAAVGAPHIRDRIWIIAYPQREQLREQPGRGGWQSGSGALLAAVDGEDRHVAHPGSQQTERNAAASAARQSEPSGSGDVADANGGDRYRRGCIVQMGREWLPREVAKNGYSRGTQWSAEPDVGRVANGVPARVHRLRALGNAVVPQIPEIIGRAILAHAAPNATQPSSSCRPKTEP